MGELTYSHKACGERLGPEMLDDGYTGHEAAHRDDGGWTPQAGAVLWGHQGAQQRGALQPQPWRVCLAAGLQLLLLRLLMLLLAAPPPALLFEEVTVPRLQGASGVRQGEQVERRRWQQGSAAHQALHEGDADGREGRRLAVPLQRALGAGLWGCCAP